MKHILFVCSGNTCRSPMAEGIARAVLAAAGIEDIEVSSAGTSGMDGMPVSGHSRTVAAGAGIHIDAHRSRLLTRAVVRDADLIVTMGARHRETVAAVDPDAIRHTYLLSDFLPAGVGDDVPDPIGGTLETYQATYDRIHEAVRRLIEGIDSFDGWKKVAGS